MTTTADRRRRVRLQRAGLATMVAGTAVFSTACTLGDISTILSILKALGII